MKLWKIGIFFLCHDVIDTGAFEPMAEVVSVNECFSRHFVCLLSWKRSVWCRRHSANNQLQWGGWVIRLSEIYIAANFCQLKSWILNSKTIFFQLFSSSSFYRNYLQARPRSQLLKVELQKYMTCTLDLKSTVLCSDLLCCCII